MSSLLLVIIVAALVLGYLAGRSDQRRTPKTSEWWDGWQVGRDHGMRAQRLGAGRSDDLT